MPTARKGAAGGLEVRCEDAAHGAAPLVEDVVGAPEWDAEAVAGAPEQDAEDTAGAPEQDAEDTAGAPEPPDDSPATPELLHAGLPHAAQGSTLNCILGRVNVDPQQGVGAVLGTITSAGGTPVRFRQVVGPAGGPVSVTQVNGQEAVLCGRLIRQDGTTFLDVTRVIRTTPPVPDLLPLLLLLLLPLILLPLVLLGTTSSRRGRRVR